MRYILLTNQTYNKIPAEAEGIKLLGNEGGVTAKQLEIKKKVAKQNNAKNL